MEASVTKKIKPNFVGIGPQKSGSTALFHYMAQHPEIYLSPLKNTKYFASDWSKYPDLHEHSRTKDEYLAGKKARFHLVSKEEHFYTYFEGAEGYPAIGEITPSYIALEGTAQRIYDFNPEMKIIAVLRNPADRVFSQYNFYRQKGRQEDVGILKAIEQENEDFNAPLEYNSSFRSENNRPKAYVRQGFYARLLQVYFDVFPKEQIKVFLYEDLKKHPQQLAKETFEFLGVDTSFEPDMGQKHNVTKIAKNKGFDRLLKRSASGISKVMGQKVANAMTAPLVNMNSKPIAPMTDAERLALYNIYKDDIEALESLINKDLSAWKVK